MADNYFSAEGLSTPNKGLVNPFRCMSTFLYPRTMNEAIIWSLFLFERNATYRMAIERVVSYFISGISVTQTGEQEDSDNDDVTKFKETLENTYDILESINRFGVELAALGNVFVSCERLFSRLLLCPDCSWQMALKQLRKGRD